MHGKGGHLQNIFHFCLFSLQDEERSTHLLLGNSCRGISVYDNETEQAHYNWQDIVSGEGGVWGVCVCVRQQSQCYCASPGLRSRSRIRRSASESVSVRQVPMSLLPWKPGASSLAPPPRPRRCGGTPLNNTHSSGRGHTPSITHTLHNECACLCSCFGLPIPPHHPHTLTGCRSRKDQLRFRRCFAVTLSISMATRCGSRSASSESALTTSLPGGEIISHFL